MTILKDRRRRGFTLIELLVVVAIIALLMAILLPSLAGAKRLAKSAKCAANLHGIAEAELAYASEWNDAIAGGATTSASALYSNASKGTLNSSFPSMNPPPVFQVFDWMTPLASALNIPLSYPSGNNQSSNFKYMFETERNSKILLCPSNSFTAGPYGGSVPQSVIGPMVSYNMGLMFLYNAGYPTNDVLNNDFLTLPNGYTPRISLVGSPSRKIMVADGSRFATTATPPDYDLTSLGTEGETDADIGTFDSFSRSWDRGLAPGNGNPNGGMFEARFYAYRHGNGVKGGPAGSFKMNAAFYDGHAETMDDLTSADPALWCPSGTLVPLGEAWADSSKKYMGGKAFTVP